MQAQRWRVGDATLTAVTEAETAHIPPEIFFPSLTQDDIRAHPHLVPDHADEFGNVTLRIQAFVIEHRDRRVLVDPCVGNAKRSDVPFWHEQTWPFLERFTAAGFDPSTVDTVVHTHLHSDHVGWDTHLVDGTWVPTFTNARHLYTEDELAYCRAGGNPGVDHAFEESVAPVIDAGLADVVAPDTDLGDGMRLVPTAGHTPGHVSLWLESDGEVALLAGDFLHNPIQCERPEVPEVGDEDIEAARATRLRMLDEVARRGAVFTAAHFAGEPVGRLVADGEAWRFHPIPGERFGPSID